MKRRLRDAPAVALLAVGVAAMTACSFTSGLLPTAGTNPNVYFAAANVLTAKDVPILRLPACTLDANGTSQTCKGTTLNKQEILVVADQSKTEIPMTIKVGGKVVFTGSATEVMAKAATKP